MLQQDKIAGMDMVVERSIIMKNMLEREIMFAVQLGVLIHSVPSVIYLFMDVASSFNSLLPFSPFGAIKENVYNVNKATLGIHVEHTDEYVYFVEVIIYHSTMLQTLDIGVQWATFVLFITQRH